MIYIWIAMNLEIWIKLPLSFDRNCSPESLKDLDPVKFCRTPFIIISEQRKGTLLLMTEELAINYIDLKSERPCQARLKHRFSAWNRKTRIILHTLSWDYSIFLNATCQVVLTCINLLLHLLTHLFSVLWRRIAGCFMKERMVYCPVSLRHLSCLCCLKHTRSIKHVEEQDSKNMVYGQNIWGHFRPPQVFRALAVLGSGVWWNRPLVSRVRAEGASGALVQLLALPDRGRSGCVWASRPPSTGKNTELMNGKIFWHQNHAFPPKTLLW